jgi:hypothetical protein
MSLAAESPKSTTKTPLLQCMHIGLSYSISTLQTGQFLYFISASFLNVEEFKFAILLHDTSLFLAFRQLLPEERRQHSSGPKAQPSVLLRLAPQLALAQ